ncbi:MAG: hypothetical protein K2N72_11915 [Oscillospiraceae bacterium]|nr:hypothetical protein [Oscillospiraceae bacterium]
MNETARLIIGLKAAGWSEKEINDFILFIATGEEQFKPKNKTAGASKGAKAKKTTEAVKQYFLE